MVGMSGSGAACLDVCGIRVLLFTKTVTMSAQTFTQHFCTDLNGFHEVSWLLFSF